MGFSVSATFERVFGFLPRELRSSGLERCARIAARIPEAASSHYLEFRLNSTEQVDVLTYCEDKRIVEDFATQLGSRPSRVWSENLKVLEAWARQDGELADAPFVFLEYDAGEDFVEAEPEPSVSIGIEADYYARYLGGLRGQAAPELALGRRAYGRLLPLERRESVLAVLDRCYAALPAGGAIPHAAVMSTRVPVTAKPYIVLPRPRVLEYLKKIGWPGSLDAVARLLETYYAPFRESVYLDVTITDRIEARLGLATSQFQFGEVDENSLDWWKLPGQLGHYKAALKAWVGHSEEEFDGKRLWLHRWLDTKAVLKGEEIEYKAYLGFSLQRPPLFC
jgi:hypothetical protein